MKIVHICGPSAVGKNFLLNKLTEIVKKKPGNLSESEKLLLTRFEATGRCVFPGPVSEKWSRELTDLEHEIKRFAEDGQCDTIFHRWQSRSSKIIPYASKILPEYEQKTFIIWLDPIRHQQQALTYRSSYHYTDWSYNRVKGNFRNCLKDVFAHVKQSYDSSDEEDYPQVKLADIPSQLKELNIEVVTPISSHPLSNLYATVDEENLRLILAPD